MDYALDRFIAEVEQSIAASGKVPAELLETQAPKANVPADRAFPAFRAAKQLGVVPQQLAAEIVAAIRLPSPSLIGDVEQAGPFVNFRVHPQHFAAAVLADILDRPGVYGHQQLGGGRSIVVDYSAPNIAKRMHVGHIRSTIIGQALVHLYRALGYRVIGDNHVGDWGTQFGTIIASIMREGKPTDEGEAAMARLESMYARYSAAAREDPTLEEEARRWSLRLEQGDPQARELWQWCVDLTMQAAQHNYDRLSIAFDHAYGESFYEPMLPAVIQETLDKGVAYRDAGGAVVVEDLEGNLPTFLLQRSDGGTLYITRDLATVIFRLEQFAPERIIYVVGAPQELHFRQLFALIRALGYAENVKLVHVSFGTVFDANGQALSTRKGNMVYLEALLNEAVARARAVVEQKNPTLPDSEKNAVAEAVGIGAVVYNDLYQDTRRNITLDWERMLATEGNSATYLQYSHARCSSILRRASEDGGAAQPAEPALAAQWLTHPSEQRLLLHLARLPEVIREAAERYAPFVVADWIYTSAREFGVFFEQCSVLKAESEALRTARLALVAATAEALRSGLDLLGIKAPRQM